MKHNTNTPAHALELLADQNDQDPSVNNCSSLTEDGEPITDLDISRGWPQQ